MTPLIGEIRIFAGNHPPEGWAFCDGQILEVSQNPALFSIIGPRYGGDGYRTFALPNLTGKAPVGCGQGENLTKRELGSTGGSSTVRLSNRQLPRHHHIPQCTTISGTPVSSPENAVFTNIRGRHPAAYTTVANAKLASYTVQIAGEGEPHENMQPYLGLSFIIALQGIYPIRP
ncbi:phage tail protein [Tindallia californiensis]|uniref:Microcystin-dependent protein n=1 Tax=Tindallia californiensis TaxID=159292 RepID=A0A1H3LV18_9FIRM|nr:tail fiber protein [Tindallia californiensis]SDY67919.1 Microcystin-dependent protein [Tindallia californiensis]